MQVTEVTAEGLRHEFKVVVPADDIESRVQDRLKKLSRTVRMPGFRPGKAPIGLLRKQYGRAVMGEILEEAVDAGSKQALEGGNLRPALRPKIEVTAFDEGKDLEFSMAVEVLPEVPQIELGKIVLEKPVAKADDERVDKAVQSFARSRQEYQELETPRPAAEGDRLTIDFQGRIDGEPFEGGKGDGALLVLGSGMMMPGFEDQLVGVEAGQNRDVELDFPDSIGREDLQGKHVVFAVTVHKIEAPLELAIDDAFAESMGLENLEELRTTMRERIQREFDQIARQKAKRRLLDHLAEAHVFEVPPGMVDIEFESIWRQLEQEMKQTGQAFGNDGGETGEDETKTREEYRQIADRRVRLGLILSDIGTKNGLTVDQDELHNAVMQQARQYPGRERELLEFFQKNPSALEQVRAPLFEDKVVDFVFELATINESEVSPEELMKDDDEEGEVPVAAAKADDADKADK